MVCKSSFLRENEYGMRETMLCVKPSNFPSQSISTPHLSLGYQSPGIIQSIGHLVEIIQPIHDSAFRTHTDTKAQLTAASGPDYHICLSLFSSSAVRFPHRTLNFVCSYVKMPNREPITRGKHTNNKNSNTLTRTHEYAPTRHNYFRLCLLCQFILPDSSH